MRKPELMILTIPGHGKETMIEVNLQTYRFLGEEENTRATVGVNWGWRNRMARHPALGGGSEI